MAIIKRPETAILYSRFKYKGRTYLRSTGTTKLREAETWERRFRTELENTPEGPELYPPVSELAELDLARATQEGKSSQYINDGLRWYWQTLAAHFRNSQEVTEESLQVYVQQRLKVVRGQTVRKELTCLKRGLKLGKVPVPHTWPKVPISEPRESQEGTFIPLPTLRVWLSELSGEAKAMATIAILTGLRSTEIYRIEKKWIRELPKGSPIPAVLHLPAGKTKGRKKREVGLVDEALEAISHAPFMKAHKTTYKAASRRAGSTRSIHLRDLRHTFGTMAGDLTGDALGVAMLMGHHSGLMTMRYQSMPLERMAKIALAIQQWVYHQR